MDNGRVNMLKGDNYKLYKLFETGNDKMSDFSREAVSGIHTNTPLNTMFFSRENIKALQQGIRFLVAKRSNNQFVIGNQSETELQVIMRAIYLNDAQHKPYAIIEQVKELNKLVLDYCVPRILEEVRMYNHYKSDVSQLPMPLDRGEFSSSKGLRVLESREF
jgi:hypothetical protein